MRKCIKFILLYSIILSLTNDIYSYNESARKHYGMSYYVKCTNYIKSFTCMSACKSIGFQVFRMDVKCKCSCHELKTTTILPFFKWRTNGTIKRVHKTVSVSLYHIVGTLSPPPLPESDDNENTTIPSLIESTTLSDGAENTTTISVNETSTEESNNESTSTPGEGESTTTAEPAAE